MKDPKVCVVTPVHNDWSATRRYLSSVANLTYPNIETIVIDDGSTDRSADYLAQEFPDVIVILGDGNLWWTGATNIGAEVALSRGAGFIFTCNNDVVLDPDVISSSVACARQAGKALVGAVVFRQDDPDRVWFAGARFDHATGDISLDTDLPTPGQPKETGMLTGMGMLIPSEAFEDVRGFDQARFPHYLADSDFSLRAAQQGYRLLIAAQSKIFNDVSSAWSAREFDRGRLGFLLEMLLSKRSPYYVVARARFYRRHWGPGWLRALLRLYATWLRKYAAPLVKRRVLVLLGR